MKCIEIQENTLHPAQRPVPAPGDGEVLIKVQAAGVNRPDILQRLGHYPPSPGITDIPGLEVAGEIIESKSSLWKKGDKVCALLAGGGYAEYAVAPAGQCLPIPAGLSMVEAAALPETFFTVWNNVFVRGQLKAGETVLIHGGASGIGTTAIQMAKALGATVIVTAGTDDKCKACRHEGADLAINYKAQDYHTIIEKTYGRNSVHVVLDMVGGDYIGRDMKVMATDGRHVSIAYLGGSKATIDIQTLMTKRLILTGSTLRARPPEEKAALAAQLEKKIWPLIEAGKIRPVIQDSFPLAKAQEAHDALEKGDHVGKFILICA